MLMGKGLGERGCEKGLWERDRGKGDVACGKGVVEKGLWVDVFNSIDVFFHLRSVKPKRMPSMPYSLVAFTFLVASVIAWMMACLGL